MLIKNMLKSNSQNICRIIAKIFYKIFLFHYIFCGNLAIAGFQKNEEEVTNH
jgi:hypothetical protein